MNNEKKEALKLLQELDKDAVYRAQKISVKEGRRNNIGSGPWTGYPSIFTWPDGEIALYLQAEQGFDFIRTSPIQRATIIGGKLMIETENSIYRVEPVSGGDNT